mmetsp:Transcript_30011/g.64838  ORF Transcript_30011/g.64838 Transcript_30011/m.64838 type:complete len:238 (+) Transcript_30011:189-902(+)
MSGTKIRLRGHNTTIPQQIVGMPAGKLVKRALTKRARPAAKKASLLGLRQLNQIIVQPPLQKLGMALPMPMSSCKISLLCPSKRRASSPQKMARSLLKLEKSLRKKPFRGANHSPSRQHLPNKSRFPGAAPSTRRVCASPASSSEGPLGAIWASSARIVICAVVPKPGRSRKRPRQQSESFSEAPGPTKERSELPKQQKNKQELSREGPIIYMGADKIMKGSADPQVPLIPEVQFGY